MVPAKAPSRRLFGVAATPFVPGSKNFTSSAPVGRPPSQLPAVDQLVSVPLAPVHVMVAAAAGNSRQRLASAARVARNSGRGNRFMGIDGVWFVSWDL